MGLPRSLSPLETRLPIQRARTGVEHRQSHEHGHVSTLPARTPVERAMDLHGVVAGEDWELVGVDDAGEWEDFLECAEGDWGEDVRGEGEVVRN
jgi:hypothetical protein